MHQTIERLKQFRKEKGLTQLEMAEALELDITSYNRIERGVTKKIDINLIEKAAKKLNRAIIEFFDPMNAPRVMDDGSITTLSNQMEELEALAAEVKRLKRENELQERIIKLMEEKEKK